MTEYDRAAAHSRRSWPSAGRFKQEPEPQKGADTALALNLHSAGMDITEAMDSTCSQLYLPIPGHSLAETQPLLLPL